MHLLSPAPALKRYNLPFVWVQSACVLEEPYPFISGPEGFFPSFWGDYKKQQQKTLSNKKSQKL